MERAEQRLEDAIKNVDPELVDTLPAEKRSRARTASILAKAQVKAAERDRRKPPAAYLELLGAASALMGDYLGGT